MIKHYGIICAFITALIWGSLPLIMKFGLEVFSGTFISFTRIFGTFIILYIYFKIKGEKIIILKNKLVVLAGLTIAMNYLAFIHGLQLSIAITTEIIAQFGCILMICVGILVLKEQVNKYKIIGIILSVTGVFIVIWNGANWLNLLNETHLIGSLIVLFSAIIWPIYGYTQVVTNRKLDPLMGLLTIFFYASIFIVPIGLLETVIYEHNIIFNLKNIFLLLILILAALIPYVTLAKSYKYIESSTTTIIILSTIIITPILSTILKSLGYSIFNNEIVTTFTVVGGLLIFIGITLAVKSLQKTKLSV